MISLSKLVLENFMNISSANFDFNSKIIIISGKSGTGKSAIIDALALCLSSKKRSALYSEYVKQGCTHSKVVLDCVINNEPVNFNLQINLTRGTPFQMALTYKNKVYKNTEASDILQSFDIEYYADIIFSMQSDDFKDITQLSPTQRANYLQRLLNFDFVKEKEKLKKDIDDFTVKLSTINNDIHLYEQLKIKEDTGKETPIEITIKEDDVTLNKEKIEKNQALITKAEKEQKQINDLNKEFNSNAEKLNTLAKEENELTNRLTVLSNYSSDLQKSDKEIEDIEEEIENYKQDIRQLDIQIENEHKRITDIIADINKSEAEEKNVSKTRTKLLEVQKLYKEKKCPHCGQPTETHAITTLDQILKDSSYNKKNVKITSLLDVIGYFEKEMLTCGYEITKKNALKTTVENSINEIKTEKALSLSSITSLEAKKKALQNKIENTTYDPSELIDTKEKLEKLYEEIYSIKMDQDKIKLDLTKFITYNISSLSDEILKSTSIINEYESAIKKNNEIKERNKKREESVKNYIAKIETLQKETGNITSQLNIYNEAYNILDKTLPNYMVVNTCGKLQEEMNNFIQCIFPNYEVRLSNSKKGCEFFYTKDKTVIEHEKKKNNAWINAKMSSGFEKAALTLSFKVSLAQLYGLNIFIGDEIDQSADNESSEKLFENFLNLSFDQIFLITHKNEIKDFLNENASSVKTYEAVNGVFFEINN
jgi:DNA repair exonuclease SbcCD ATPase subunit